MRNLGRYLRQHHIALLALFVALGGTSYAAIILPANSVGPRQLKKKAVTNAKIRTSAVTSAKVKDFSLLKKDFKPGQLPAGPRGAQGATGQTGTTGQTGPTGPSDAYHTGTGGLASFGTLTKAVPAGDYVVHAKAVADSPTAASVVVTCTLSGGSAPLDTSFATISNGTKNDSQTVSNLFVTSFAAPGTIRFGCSAQADNATVRYSKLVAIKVGTAQ